MHLPTRYATKIGAASISLLAVTVFFSLAAQSQSQDPVPQKPAAPAASPNASPAPKKMGTELDDRTSVITNTDLITLTVTVTDTYGRYVSGLSKNAFTILDDKQPQDITFFSDDDAPVSVGVIFDVSG